MLTIRVNGLHGDQQIFQCASVIRGAPTEMKPTSRSESEGRLEFYDDKHAQCHEPVHYGSVYVMNENGKTVAHYDLGGWPETVVPVALHAAAE